MCTASIDYDIPLAVDEMEKLFQPQEWPDHKDSWIKYIDTRDGIFQDNDVIVSTFPRSGTHICWYIVELLLHGADFESDKYTFDDLAIINRYAKFDAYPGPARVLHTSMKPCDVGHKVLLTGNRRVIHMIRNPKDVALSFYKLCFDVPTYFALPKSFEDWVNDFCTDKTQSYGHTWVSHARSWEEFAKRPGVQVCCVTFEEFIKDRRSVIERISRFLKLDRSTDDIERVTEKLSFSNMSNFKQNEAMKVLFDASENEDASFFKKGKIGSWKDAFTVAQSEKFDAEIKKRMEGSQFYALYY